MSRSGAVDEWLTHGQMAEMAFVEMLILGRRGAALVEGGSGEADGGQ